MFVILSSVFNGILSSQSCMVLEDVSLECVSQEWRTITEEVCEATTNSANVSRQTISIVYGLEELWIKGSIWNKKIALQIRKEKTLWMACWEDLHLQNLSQMLPAGNYTQSLITVHPHSNWKPRHHKETLYGLFLLLTLRLKLKLSSLEDNKTSRRQGKAVLLVTKKAWISISNAKSYWAGSLV